MSFNLKYLKYKNKYLQLKNKTGGAAAAAAPPKQLPELPHEAQSIIFEYGESYDNLVNILRSSKDAHKFFNFQELFEQTEHNFSYEPFFSIKPIGYKFFYFYPELLGVIPENVEDLPPSELEVFKNRTWGKLHLGKKRLVKIYNKYLPDKDKVELLIEAVKRHGELKIIFEDDLLKKLLNKSITFNYNKDKPTSIEQEEPHTKEQEEAIRSDQDFLAKLLSPEVFEQEKIIKSETFKRMNITHITIPNYVTIIEANAFPENYLTSVTIPDSVKKIHPNAFKPLKI